MNLIKLDAIDSTNDYLKSLASELSLRDDTVVWAYDQLNGRGQRGASWHSERYKSLTFSILKKIDTSQMKHLFLVSIAVSVAVARFLRTLNIPQLTVKWPNDIMSADSKIAGILIENQFKAGRITNSIIGIGINVNSFTDSYPDFATTIEDATQSYHDPEEILTGIVKEISGVFKKELSETADELSAEYHQQLFRKDIVSPFLDGQGNPFEGKILGVNDQGQLMVDTEGQIINFDLKSIKFKL